ncbi:hypothetical protein HanPI659440_Chr16g0642681 [Helianthus annuus]|nr:hypothetical protein HanPI659440_Chr16g0642681 [Helianthus annuus]
MPDQSSPVTYRYCEQLYHQIQHVQPMLPTKPKNMHDRIQFSDLRNLTKV